MNYIPTIFLRNEVTPFLVYNKPNSLCKWVFEGEGRATRMYDGIPVLIKDGLKYIQLKIFSEKGKRVDEPLGFVRCYVDDKNRVVGWAPLYTNPNLGAIALNTIKRTNAVELYNGTYELIGPDILSNSDHVSHNQLVRHDNAYEYSDVPRTFDELVEWFKPMHIHGLVFHHQDGRMAKIKKSDFGQDIPW